MNDINYFLDRLIIVFNGKLSKEGKKVLYKITVEIVVRENIGFDAGAYADIFVNYLGKNDLLRWDEIIIFNDTFWGPFISFSDIFNEMENKKVDFWGLNYVDNAFWSYIESYFLVFKHRVVQSNAIYSYFENILDLTKKEEKYSYLAFEMGIFNSLVDYGYTFDTFSNTKNCSIYYNCDVCLEKYHLPILKKKSFNKEFFCFERQIYTLKYISLKTDYDITLILEYIKRKYESPIIIKDIINFDISQYILTEKKIGVPESNVSREKIKMFLNTKKKIYIYGTGTYAKVIWYGYKEYIRNFGGFVVSDSEWKENEYCCGIMVKKYSDIENNRKIILGMGCKNTFYVKETLGNSNDILALWK